MAQRIKAIDNLLVQELQGEMVILSLDTETFYSLNSMALQMWELLTSGKSVDEVVAVLSGGYDIDTDVLQADLEEFVQQLKAAALIEIHED